MTRPPVRAVAILALATGCASPQGHVTTDAAPPLSPCVMAGGECGVSACKALGSQSCDVTGETCCLDGLGPSCDADGGAAAITASSYDPSCDADTDCVGIGVGDPCYPCEVLCAGTAAINVSSLAQYNADVAKSPAGRAGVACACPEFVPANVCCSAGKCALYCLDVGDAEPKDAGADAAD
jgi:hypothetical protein